MKPSVDWSPCQQKGEEHAWDIMEYDPDYVPDDKRIIWWCTKCGIFVSNVTGKSFAS